jgi:hypothetical protein
VDCLIPQLVGGPNVVLTPFVRFGVVVQATVGRLKAESDGMPVCLKFQGEVVLRFEVSS